MNLRPDFWVIWGILIWRSGVDEMEFLVAMFGSFSGADIIWEVNLFYGGLGVRFFLLGAGEVLGLAG